MRQTLETIRVGFGRPGKKVATDVLGAVALEGPGTILIKDTAQLPSGFTVPWMLRAFVNQGHKVQCSAVQSRDPS